MALQIEDFASTNDFGPLSSVPLQFLVFVFALPGVSCGTLINFVGETPADGTCIAVPQQSVYSSRIVARSIGRNRYCYEHVICVLTDALSWLL